MLLRPYRLADRCVTNGEWLAFIEAGGYREPLLWLADGWGAVKTHGWQAPGYWEERDGVWQQMTLEGLLPVDPRAPVAHVSLLRGQRLRAVGRQAPADRVRVGGGERRLPARRQRPLHQCAASPPGAAAPAGRLAQLFGDVWEWTASAYQAYPGYRAPAGAVGEYNGKFMVSQQVLRGGSCATPGGHIRATYRNFFYPHQRWQFTGLRLAEDAA